MNKQVLLERSCSSWVLASVVTLPTQQGAGKAVCTGGGVPGKVGRPGQDGKMLSHPMPLYCLSSGSFGLNNSDTLSSSVL